MQLNAHQLSIAAIPFHAPADLHVTEVGGTEGCFVIGWVGELDRGGESVDTVGVRGVVTDVEETNGVI